MVAVQERHSHLEKATSRMISELHELYKDVTDNFWLIKVALTSGKSLVQKNAAPQATVSQTLCASSQV